MNAPQTLVAPPEEGAGIGAPFTLPAARASELRRAVETVLDPFGIVAPIVHAQFAWWAHPLERAELAMRYAADVLALAIHSAAKLAGQDVPDAVRPQPDDLRFGDAA